MSVDLGELFLKLGFKLDSSDANSVKQFKNDVTALSTGFMAVRDMASDAVNGIRGFLNNTTTDAAKLQSFNNVTGESIDALQKFRIAASLADPTLSFDNSLNAMKSFVFNLEQIKLGMGNTAGFFGLRVNDIMTATPDEAINKLSDAVRKQEKAGIYSKAQIAQFIGQTGLPPEYIKILEMTKKQREDLAKSPAGQNRYADWQNYMAQSMKAAQAQTELNIATKKLNDMLVSDFAPEITDLINKLIKFVDTVSKVSDSFLRAHPTIKKVIFGFFEFLGVIMLVGSALNALKFVAAISGLTSLYGWLSKLTLFSSLGTWIMELTAVKGILISDCTEMAVFTAATNTAGLSVARLALGFLGWGAALIGAFVVAKDLFNYVEGKKSVFGDMTNTHVNTNEKTPEQVKRGQRQVNNDLTRIRHEILYGKDDFGTKFKDVLAYGALLMTPNAVANNKNATPVGTTLPVLTNQNITNVNRNLPPLPSQPASVSKVINQTNNYDIQTNKDVDAIVSERIKSQSAQINYLMGGVDK